MAPDSIQEVGLIQTDAGFSYDAGVDDLIARCQTSSSDCMPLCEHFAYWPTAIKSCKLVTGDGGLAVHIVETTPCGGRCPEGLAPPASGGAGDPLGAWLAANAHPATDPTIRSAMVAIARDETRHAALAWAVDGWSQALLAPPARGRVREARREAIEGLLGAPLAGLSRDDRAQAGLPGEEEEARMAGALGARLV